VADGMVDDGMADDGMVDVVDVVEVAKEVRDLIVLFLFLE
jgi:hypothetical protein